MKKLLVIAALLVSAAVIFSFTGCSHPSSSSDEDKSGGTTSNTDAGSEGNGGNGGGETPAPVVTYTITIADGITNGTVTASKTSGISAGETITLTITPEESDSYDCAFVSLSVKNGNDDVTVNGTGNTRTFTMPAANVNVDATFSKTTYIGSKKPSVAKAVGDIVFNDGSATPYTSGMTITDEQKTAAIALIFYKGTGLNSGNDTTTSTGALVEYTPNLPFLVQGYPE